jgi:chromosome partitioning protein
MSAAERIAVMEGEFDGIDLVEILQVVSIGRQYTGVELRKADQSLCGTLFIKSGKVVAAVSGEAQGKEAFFMLFQNVQHEPRKFFHVFRTETPQDMPQPVGSLGNLLMEALERVNNALPALPQKASSGMMPRPAQAAIDSATKGATTLDTVPPSAAHLASRAPAAAASAPPSQRRRPSSAQNEVTLPRQNMPASQRHPSNDVAPRSESSARMEAVRAESPRAEAAPKQDVVARREAARPAQSGLSGQIPAVRPQPPQAAKVSSGGGGRRHIVLGIASPKGGSGKTTIALNLSLSFARQGRTVVLLDTDINGDVLSSIQARERAEFGSYDVLLGRAPASAALLRTVLNNFRIMPALGQDLPDPALLAADQESAWHKLIGQVSDEVEIVVIDMPAGMFGPTLQIATRCTHLLGVLQAEQIASRSFSMFKRAVELIPPHSRPEVAGVVLNMLQSRQAGSISVLQDACASLPRGWLLDTAIPRSEAFLHATEEGLPLRLLDDSNPPAVSWLFDTLATELTERMGLEVAERKPRQLLL